MSRVEKRYKVKKDDEKLLNEIRRARLDVTTAENFFDFVKDPELIDVAIYDLEAKKSRYAYLIRMAKEQGVKSTWAESLG